MKTKFIYLTILLVGLLLSCKNNTVNTNQITAKNNNTLIGKWIRIGHSGPICFDFKENGLVECDFGNDQTIDVVAEYEIQNDTIRFIDKQGQMCKGHGQYKFYHSEYNLAFDLIEDKCGGRIKTNMGYWTKPNFKDILITLDKELSKSPNPNSLINRARIYMAVGESKPAKKDLDSYILNDSTNARAYINRAGTRFPNDLEGVVFDCNKAIVIEPNNKNAYFLRGLARYDLGEQEKACEDFNKAIELGFSILKVAEQEKCAEFWNKNNNKENN